MFGRKKFSQEWVVVINYVLSDAEGISKLKIVFDSEAKAQACLKSLAEGRSYWDENQYFYLKDNPKVMRMYISREEGLQE